METVFIHVNLRLTYKEIAVLTNVWVGSENIHITDLFPLHDSVICFCGLGSTAVQSISNIYCRMHYIAVCAKLILEDRIVTQEFLNSQPDRNNCKTSFSYFLQPRVCLLISSQQNFISVADGLMSIGYTLTPGT